MPLKALVITPLTAATTLGISGNTNIRDIIAVPRVALGQPPDTPRTSVSYVPEAHTPSI